MESGTKPLSRIASVDALRGAVMIVMALDHVRDFFHSTSMSVSATDLSRTTPLLFLTRWITHFCLPVFMFTAGTGAYLWWRRGGHTKGRLSRFLWTRGVWFIVLELTVLQLAYDFNFSSHNLILLLVLWIFGICMIPMAALVRLRFSWLLALSLAIVFLHNTLDAIAASSFGRAAWLWNLLHQPGLLTVAGRQVLITYTLLPWIGVMAAGFCFGRLLESPPLARQRMMRVIGTAAIGLFFVLRLINRYGDPAPWSRQKSPLFTALSFLNCTKYPGSLDFLLMTLGPALVLLAFLDRRSFSRANPLIVFGRVPMFYFVLHLFLIHAYLVLLGWVRFGTGAFSFMLNAVPSMGGPAKLFPPNFFYSLPVVYVMWIVVVATLYPVCRWFANIKSTRRSWWLPYL